MDTTAAPGASSSAPPLPPLPPTYRTPRTSRTRDASHSCSRPESDRTPDSAPTRPLRSARTSDVPLRMIVNPRPSLRTKQQHRPPLPPSSFRDSPTKQFNSNSVMPAVPADSRIPRLKGETPVRSRSMRVQTKTEAKVRLPLQVRAKPQLRKDVPRPASELGYASTPGRTSPLPLFGLNSRLESLRDRPLSDVFKAQVQALSTPRDRDSCDSASLGMKDPSPRTPSRLPSILIRRRAARSPSPTRMSNDLDQLIPKVVRTKTFGIPDDEDSPKLLRQESTGSVKEGSMTLNAEPQSPVPGVASTRVLYQPTYQKLNKDSVPSTPRALSGSASSSESHLQTPPPELVAQALNTHSNLLIQQSAFLAEISQQFGQLAREALEWEDWLRHNLPKACTEDKGVQVSSGRARTVSFQSAQGLGSHRDTFHSASSWDNLQRAEQAWDRAMKELNDVRGLLNELKRPSQIHSDEASCGSCSQDPCLTRQDSKPCSQASHRGPHVPESQGFYRPESQHTFRPSKSDLTPTPDDQRPPPLLSHAAEQQLEDHTDVKSSDESSSGEWVCADVSMSVQAEKHRSPTKLQQASTESCRAEFQRRIASAVTTDDSQKTALTPVLEVDSLRFTVSRSSTRAAAELQSPSQSDLATSLSRNGSAHSQLLPNFQQPRLPVPLFQSKQHTHDSNQADDWQQPEHRRSLVIGTTSENPTVPVRARSPPVEGTALLRTFSKRGRRWWRNMSSDK